MFGMHIFYNMHNAKAAPACLSDINRCGYNYIKNGV